MIQTNPRLDQPQSKTIRNIKIMAEYAPPPYTDDTILLLSA